MSTALYSTTQVALPITRRRYPTILVRGSAELVILAFADRAGVAPPAKVRGLSMRTPHPPLGSPSHRRPVPIPRRPGRSSPSPFLSLRVTEDHDWWRRRDARRREEDDGFAAGVLDNYPWLGLSVGAPERPAHVCVVMQSRACPVRSTSSMSRHRHAGKPARCAGRPASP